jgi:hypothetical protein
MVPKGEVEMELMEETDNRNNLQRPNRRDWSEKRENGKKQCESIDSKSQQQTLKLR